MPDYVHVLLLPLIPPSQLLKSLKGYTVREVNRPLGTAGQPFWQRESYSHWVRDEAEWNRIVAYIEINRVKAGLVKRPENYPWSTAHSLFPRSGARTAACRLGTLAETCPPAAPRRTPPAAVP